MIQLGLWTPKLSSVGSLFNLFQAQRKAHFLVAEADFTIGKSTAEMKRDNVGFRNLPFCYIRRHTIISVGQCCGTATVMFSSKAECLHDCNLPNTAPTPFFLACRASRLKMLQSDN